MASSKYSKIARSKIDPERKREIRRSLLVVKRIHELRRKKNLSQKDLADALAVTPSLMSKWLSGMHNFTLDTIDRFERVFEEPILEITKDDSAKLLIRKGSK